MNCLKKISYPISRNKILFFKQNQISLISKDINQNIMGICSTGIATCGTILISFENDKYLIFSHFDENYYIINEISKKIKEIKNEKINNINIFFSRGIGPIENQYLNSDDILDNIIKLIKVNYSGNKNIEINEFQKIHNYPITCLKLLEIDENNKNFFEIIMEYTLKKLQKNKSIKWIKEVQKKKLFIFQAHRNEPHNKYNLTYYFNEAEIFNIVNVFGLEIINIE